MADTEEKPKPIQPTLDQLMAFLKNPYSEDAGPLRVPYPKKKADGGSIKKYAHGGSVRKTKLSDY